MKRFFLSLLSLVAVLQCAIAQSEKPATLSVYPAFQNVASLIRPINKKLLPYQKHITSKSLIDLLDFISTEIDKASPSSPTDDALFYVSEQNRSMVQSLLNLAKEKGLYDTSHYQLLLSRSPLDKDLYDLHVIDLKSPVAIPTLSITNAHCGKSSDGNPVFQLSLTRDAAIAFTKLTYQEVDNNIVVLLDGKFLATMFVDSGVSTTEIEIPNEMGVVKAEEIVRRLKSTAVKEAPLKPLYRPQYVIGDTMTYRFTARKEEGKQTESHVFRFIPRLVNDKLTRIECIEDTLHAANEKEMREYEEVFQKIIDYTYDRLRKSHIMIETDLTTHTAVSTLINSKTFLKEIEEYLIENAAMFGASKEEMQGAAKQMAEEILKEVSADFTGDNMARRLPELEVMTVMDYFFSEGQTQGTCYFPCAKNLVDYTIAQANEGLVITLKTKDKDSDTEERYIYHIDKQGLIQRLEYQWIVKQEATEKDKGMSDVEAYGYLIEHTN